MRDFSMNNKYKLVWFYTGTKWVICMNVSKSKSPSAKLPTFALAVSIKISFWHNTTSQSAVLLKQYRISLQQGKFTWFMYCLKMKLGVSANQNAGLQCKLRSGRMTNISWYHSTIKEHQNGLRCNAAILFLSGRKFGPILYGMKAFAWCKFCKPT